MIPIDLLGKKFSRLTVIEYDENSRGTGQAYWLCRCTCGRYKYVRANHLRSGNVTSCGCRSKEVSRIFLTKYANSNAHKGAGNPQWKGDLAKYSSIHTWLNKHFNKKECEDCGSIKNLDWALLKGKKHSHNRSNYRVLCRSHHLIYDYTDSRKNKISRSLFGRKRKPYAKARG